jgi:hypothetical protein
MNDEANNLDQPTQSDIAAGATVTARRKKSGNSKTHHQAAPDAPITVGNPIDAASLAIDQKHMEDFTTPDMQPGSVECRRPPKGAFFTVRPESPNESLKDRAFYFVLEIEGRDPHLVAHSIANAKKDEEDTIRPVLLVRYVTMTGQEGLWPIKLNPSDGKSNRWNTSAMNVLRIAEGGKWVRIISKGEYRYQISGKSLEAVPPKFTDRTFGELINDAFPPDRVITTLDHVIWDELANGRTK